ncbi:hypothetical protein BAT_2236 [Bacillus pumilus ATCC 7061]|nr:hypothetical protein BAT_2236 [Bacillus pumilus ATCC 7061]
MKVLSVTFFSLSYAFIEMGKREAIWYNGKSTFSWIGDM